MTRCFLGSVILFITATIASDYLLSVDNLGLEQEKYTVIEQLDNHYFILADDVALCSLKTRHAYCLLDTDPYKNVYIFVYCSKNEGFKLCRYGAVLGYYDQCVLLRTTEENVERVANEGFEIFRMEPEPVHYCKTTGFKSSDYVTRGDPLITEMVAAVSEDSVRYFIKSLQAINTRYCTSYENKSIACPMVGEWLKVYGCDSVYTHTFNPSYGPNVIGIKKGKKDSSITNYCLIGGHIDGQPSTGRAPSADDNATGVALFMEVARVMKNFTFENTIQFHAWNCEELGDVGSDAIATYARENSHTIIGGALVFDMVGCTLNGNNLDVYYNEDIAGCYDFALNVFEKVADSYTNLSCNLVHNTTTKTDHKSFWNNGFNAVGCVENNYLENDAYHRSFDTLDCPVGLQDAKQVTKVTRAACAVLATLAKPVSVTSSKVGASYQKGPPAITIRRVSADRFLLTVLLPGYTGTVRLQVFDASGKEVRQDLIQKSPDDMVKLYWDAKYSFSGSGLFFVLLKTPQGQYCRKIAVIH